MGITFKETKIGLIPDDWDAVEIGKLSKVVTGSTPSTKEEEYWGKDIPFITPTDIGDSKTVAHVERYLSHKGATVSSPIPPYSVCVTCIASIGKTCITKTASVTNQQINSILPNKEFSSEYLYYMIVHNTERLKSFAGFTTVPIVKKSSFEKFLVALPPIPEQRKIAEILSTVDDTIEKTDAIIRETQQLKKGLMQKLFVNKAFMVLRKAKEEETDLKPIAIHELGEIVTGTTPSTTVREYYDNPEYMFIGPADIGQSKRIVKSANYISKQGFAVSRQLPNNAVMVVGIGATIGKVGITSEPCATNQQINTIIPNTREFPADYVYYLLVGISDYVSAFAGQTATPIMNRGEFGKMLTFIHPTLEERQKIVDILSEVDDKIETEQEFKSELERLKKGLMQVLLTGKVRVKV